MEHMIELEPTGLHDDGAQFAVSITPDGVIQLYRIGICEEVRKSLYRNSNVVAFFKGLKQFKKA